MVVPVLQTLLSLIIGLFFLQLTRRLLAGSNSGIAGAVEGGLDWLVAA